MGMRPSTSIPSLRVPLEMPLPSSAQSRSQVVGTGLVALDRIHVGTSHHLFEELGGSCGNVLISLAMLGRSVTPLLRLGMDEVGVRLERDLRHAGADTRLIVQRREVCSPIIIEMLDPDSTEHEFLFTCPLSSERFGRFQSITRHELERARPVVSTCGIFYADRLSGTICDAMEAAAAGGAIVHFEPSGIADPELFERALAVCHFFKYSIDRLSPDGVVTLRPDVFSIVTAGHDGLEVRHRGHVHRFPATPAAVVRDTCGSGDMVTLGLLDAVLQSGASGGASLTLDIVLEGVTAGQRLAAANCAYVGARGLFRERGAGHVRKILAG